MKKTRLEKKLKKNIIRATPYCKGIFEDNFKLNFKNNFKENFKKDF